MSVTDLAMLSYRWTIQRCGHRILEARYARGAATGEYACTHCGKVFTREQRDALLLGRS